jgi:hypothetical protein
VVRAQHLTQKDPERDERRIDAVVQNTPTAVSVCAMRSSERTSVNGKSPSCKN